MLRPSRSRATSNGFDGLEAGSLRSPPPAARARRPQDDRARSAKPRNRCRRRSDQEVTISGGARAGSSRVGASCARLRRRSPTTSRTSRAASSRRSSTRRSTSRSRCSRACAPRRPGGVNGLQSNPASEYITYRKNIKFDFNAGAVCTTLPPSGSTPSRRRPPARRPRTSARVAAEVQVPGDPADHRRHRRACSAGPRRTGSSCTPTARRWARRRRRFPGTVVEVERRQQVRLRAERARTPRRPAG